MPFTETEQPIPQEAMAPHSPPKVENRTLELPETRKQVDLGTYNPKPEALVNNWELLGNLPTPPNEDFKIDLIKSLGETDETITAKAILARKKRDDTANPDATDLKKISNIFTLRKLMLGHDWRAETVAANAHSYIIEKRRAIAKEVLDLNKKQLNLSKPEIKRLLALKNQFITLGQDKQNLESIIEEGYLNLWEKIKPTIETATEPAQSGKKESPGDLAAMFPDETPPAGPEATISATISAEDKIAPEKAGEEKKEPPVKILPPEENVEIEAKRWADLEEAIRELLPNHFERYLPALIDALADCGFDFAEQETQKLEKGRYQKVRQFSLFIDPNKTDLPKLIAELQSSPAGTVERRATQIVQVILEATSNAKDTNLKRILEKMKTKGHWGLAEKTDASAIIEHLHKEDESRAYAIYTKYEPGFSYNLRHINAKTGEIKDREIADPTQVSSFENTSIVRAPIFTFNIPIKK